MQGTRQVQDSDSDCPDYTELRVGQVRGAQLLRGWPQSPQPVLGFPTPKATLALEGTLPSGGQVDWRRAALGVDPAEEQRGHLETART